MPQSTQITHYKFNQQKCQSQKQFHLLHDHNLSTHLLNIEGREEMITLSSLIMFTGGSHYMQGIRT
jgi:hypothetical protein